MADHRFNHVHVEAAPARRPRRPLSPAEVRIFTAIMARDRRWFTTDDIALASGVSIAAVNQRLRRYRDMNLIETNGLTMPRLNRLLPELEWTPDGSEYVLDCMRAQDGYRAMGQME